MNTPTPYQTIRRFTRHYLEMVVAMGLGMLVLGGPAGLALRALDADAPAVMILVMAVTMTVPMVAWMRRGGHGWAASAEMSAAMFLPAFGAIALMAAGVAGYGDAMAIEHVAMFVAMFVVMLWRRDEYTMHHHAAAVVA